MTIQILPTTLGHIRELRKTLRQKDRQEAISLGLNPERGLYVAYRASAYRSTAIIDGQVAAVWGVAGPLLGFTGQPYLITGEAISLISPIKFAKIYINEVQKMKKLFPVLENYVDASYEGAVRMLKIAGFTFTPIKLNNHDFFKFSMVN